MSPSRSLSVLFVVVWLLSCIWLCDTMDCTLPGFSVHGILQARILEWVSMPYSRGPSRLRDQTWVSCIAGRFFTTEQPGKLVYLDYKLRDLYHIGVGSFHPPALTMKGPLLTLDQTNEDYLKTPEARLSRWVVGSIWYLGPSIWRQIRIWWQDGVRSKRRHPSGLGVPLGLWRDLTSKVIWVRYCRSRTKW